MEEGETLEQAAVREIEEEIGVVIVPKKLENAGMLHCVFDGKPENNRDVHVFVVRDYVGTIQETEEMKPEWFDVADIPYDAMWDGDRYWMPRLLD